ncbi:MAG TPA: dihydrodipicolinate synthase family protein [Bryobacteraceae bacterium]|nr:dihydrodipicolinate synthase family protein [Bryobacteraceae bacterium]
MQLSSRRQFIATAAAAGSSLLLKNAAGAESKRFEGIFPIVQTPFKDSGALDTDTLSNEVTFLHRMGVQGMTWPQNASEWSLLTPDERFAGAEAIVRANKAAPAATRPSVMIGVQAPTAEAALPFARHAEKIGVDGIIAIPFKNGVGKDESRQMEYYSAIASACSKPLCVQAIGDISVDLVLRMAKQNPTIQYVKDEAGVTLPRLNEYAAHTQKLRGVFSGKHGPTFIEELARGACGNMPAAGFSDLYVATWKAWKAGNVEEAEDMFSKTLLLILDAQTYGVAGQKYMLQLRGVFPNSKCRRDQSNVAFDDEAKKAIERSMNYTKRWLKSA